MSSDRSRDPTVTGAPTLDEGGRGSDRQLAGLTDYELGEVIGAGGMGEVVAARDIRIGREVAIKRMRADEPSDEQIERFLREAKIQARLDHPAIVPVYELAFDAGGRPYFTMKRLAGVTLESVIESGTLPLQRQLRTLVDVCNAIDLAHARGVVHRDLKPSNVMVGDYGEVYVIDWGVARVIGTRDSEPVITDVDAERGTVTGEMLGTPGYMAPEQIVRDVEIGPPADVYALGAMLFEILCREPLHPGGRAALMSTVENAQASPALRTPERLIPPELDELCTKALRRDPSARVSVRELRAGLERYLDGDRDLERRRAQARELAERALGAERIDALRLAGRALALDPSCEPAVGVLGRLLLEPPREVSPEVVEAVRREEVEEASLRSRRALFPFAMIVTVLGIAALSLGVVDSSGLALVVALVAAMGTMSFVNWRIRPVPPPVFFVVTLAVSISFSRITGPFVIAPSLAIGILLSLTSYPGLKEHRWAVATWTILVTCGPLVLEWLGVFEPTWWVSEAGLRTRGSIFPSEATGIRFLIAANAIGMLMVGMYALDLSRDRHLAKQRLHVQAWQLRHILPR